VTDAATAAGDAVLSAVALFGGYAAGSLPTWRLVGAGTGPGWGFLGLTAELAKGVLPVTIGIVTWSWGVGWAAGLGAVGGACWPPSALRSPSPLPSPVIARVPGLPALAGACLALAPVAAVTSVVLGLVMIAIGRLVRRDVGQPAVVLGFAAFPALFLLVERDVGRLVAVGVLYLVVIVRERTGARR
jgi:hypothetical protein